MNTMMKHDTNTANGPDSGTVEVVMIRHAQSEWNRENRFTGWADPPLTAAGAAEAVSAAGLLRGYGQRFDVAYSSRLQRAVATVDILLEALGQAPVPVLRDWRLNERHYGVLQGVDKAAATTLFGARQVWRWRRGYRDRARPLADSHPDHPRGNPLYADVTPALLPGVENLSETRTRVAAFWYEQIAPRIRRGERVLLGAHGNTLRALLMELDGMSESEVESFEIPTAAPILYRFDRAGRALGWQYLAASHGTAGIRPAAA